MRFKHFSEEPAGAGSGYGFKEMLQKVTAYAVHVRFPEDSEDIEWTLIEVGPFETPELAEAFRQLCISDDAWPINVGRLIPENWPNEEIAASRVASCDAWANDNGRLFWCDKDGWPMSEYEERLDGEIETDEGGTK